MKDESGHIFYRFGSERNIWRELQLDTNAGVLISDLKIMIAQETSLMREFARKTNLLISLYDDNKPDELQPLDDNIVVHTGSRLIINRVAWTPSKPIVHEAKTQIEPDFAGDTKKLKKFPISLICQLCHKPLNQPFLVKCSARCGCSGCKNCLQECLGESLPDFDEKSTNDEPFEIYDLEDKKACPFCGHGFVSACVKNRKMQTLLNGLDLECFELPDQVDLYFPSFIHRFGSNVDYPTHFVLEIDQDLYDVVAEKMLMPIYGDSLLDVRVKKYEVPAASETKIELDLNNMDELKVEDLEIKVKQERMELESKIYEPVEEPEKRKEEEEEEDEERSVIAIVLSRVSGAFSLTVCGIIKFLSEYPDVEFLNNTGARTSLKFQWIMHREFTMPLTALKEPLLTVLGGKRYTNVALNQNSEIRWRLKNPKMIEAGIEPKCYNNILLTVFPKSVEIEENLEKCKRSWIETCYPKGPVPLYMTEKGAILKKEEILGDTKVDYQNPYLGYTAILPFLSKSQFDQVRMTQRRVKERFLNDLTTQVICSTHPDKGKAILEKASRNVWKSHLKYALSEEDL
ncbi:conserved hypothetical protein [Theileria orientalis strain Shintoku]|uniref:DWNN domain-containing protein n=1 Tax=Theileria orientalis strain Shintoku TaxID=869250 RepID=J4C2Y5_THEOR|nr:conserved hypothetical protein [Theileria orientalis strain Shintoku]BAM39501.1 conserved hypothetical protein [Theileria orientalis strain Shintoku]|eukprot:XP_009689802.1 conserved hypothetical protein [Theileria orientalis strain Shintoku]